MFRAPLYTDADSNTYHILLIDRNREILNLLMTKYQHRYKFHYAPTCKVALEKFIQHRIIACILNYDTSKLNGLLLIKEIKKDFIYIPRILLTEHANLGLYIMASWVEYGPFRVLEKCVDLRSEIFDVLERTILYYDEHFATKVLNTYANNIKQSWSVYQMLQEIRNNRIIEIKKMIEKRPGFWSCKTLSDYIGVTPQQICKDIEGLKSRGCELEKLAHGEYSLIT